MYKNTLIKIKKSFGKYISLFIIVMLGVGFYAGLQAAPSDIIASVDKYYKENNLMDFKIVSSMGLTDNDVEALKKLDNIKKAVPSYSLDVLDHGEAIRVHAIENSMNRAKLIKGRYPKKASECLADSRKYKLGDKVKIVSDVDGKLKNTKFIVVGTMKSPLYLSRDYGTTTISDGKLISFIYINKDNFTIENYTEIYVLASNSQKAVVYSGKYKDKIALAKDEIEKIKEPREKARYQDVITMANNAMAGSNINQINKIPQVNWYIFDRENITGYKDLKSGTDTIKSVASVFPLFFILIVILMTSNTMARMIVEERNELGIFVSLGYNKGKIISTYLIYVMSATVLGALSGFFSGSYIFPKLIYATFRNFIMPSLIIQYDLISLAWLLGITIVLMTGVTLFFCHMELNQKPATLLRPVPPKKGQSILLEKVTIIWNRFSFTWKVTIRNIFRYKQRGFMTIVGVAGCTALLLTGFGLRDSINGIAKRQYGIIFKYNALIVLKSETGKLSSELGSFLKKEKVKEPALIKQTAFEAKSGKKKLESYLIVPENKKVLAKYYKLTSKITNDDIQLNNQEAVITQKIAKTLKKGKGDKIEIKNLDGRSYTLTVSDVAKNYIQNYIYISKDLYKTVFDENVSYNMIVANYKNDSKNLAQQLMKNDVIANVTFKDDIMQKTVDGQKSLNNIIVLLVVIVSILVIIVLYNLTSINISERKREIATLKVLGFTDQESNQYIYREAFIMTLISTGLGLLLGILLHRFVINVIESDTTVYFRSIHGISFVWASVIIIMVAAIMQLVTYLNIRTIDMIESLKSVE